MKWHYLNLYLLIFWVLIGLGLTFAESIAPGYYARLDAGQKQNLRWGSYGAFLVAFWNLVRFWARRSFNQAQQTPPAGPLTSRRWREGREVANPEFRFDEGDSK